MKEGILSEPPMRPEVKPIQLCSYTYEANDREATADIAYALAVADLRKGGVYEHIDWKNAPSNFPDTLSSAEKTTSQNGAFIITGVGSHNIEMPYLLNCIGCVISASTETGENISFTFHVNPYTLFDQTHHDIFMRALQVRLGALIKYAAPKTIDCVFFGGNIFNKPGVRTTPDAKPQNVATQKDDYIESISIIGNHLTRKLGFKPSVIQGPKTDPSQTDAFYQNNTRRLFLHKRLPKQDQELLLPLPYDTLVQKVRTYPVA
ncbi:MAG: hypothetical protein WAX38_03840 [Minisyncoccia bacterium]